MSGTLQIDKGPVPVTQQVDTTGQDAMSPTTMIQNYLQARGYQPTAENVRRALEANSRDPGVITGLRSDTAATNDPTGGGRGGPLRPGTPQNAINTSIAMGDRAPGTGDAPETSAAPTSVDSGQALGGLAALVPGIAKLILGGARPAPPPIPGAAPAPGGVPQIGGPEPRLALPAPAAQLGAPAPQIAPPV